MLLCFFYDININDQILQVMFRELMRHMISFMDCPLFKKNGINYFYIFIIYNFRNILRGNFTNYLISFVILSSVTETIFLKRRNENLFLFCRIYI